MEEAWETGGRTNSFCFVPMAHLPLGFEVITIDDIQGIERCFVEAV